MLNTKEFEITMEVKISNVPYRWLPYVWKRSGLPEGGGYARYTH